MTGLLHRIASVLLCLLLCVAAAAAETAEQELDEAMTALFAQYKAKGGVVVVGWGSEIVYQFAYGSARRDPQTPVTMDTQFRIASVSKMITAIGVMQQVEQGHLALDEDISAYFGGTLRNPSYRDTPITLRMIMNHTSSLNPEGDYKKGAEAICDMLDAAQGRRRNFYEYRPGTRYVYSNFNGGMLGALIEAGSGQNVSTYMQEHVFAPLGLEGAYAVSALSDPSRAAETYNANGSIHDNVTRMSQVPFDDSCDPQHHYDMTTGSLWISGPDLCKLGMLLCNCGRLNGTRLLREQTVLEMESAQKGKGGITCTSPYGLNINRIDNLLPDTLVYGHQGMSGAVLANVYYVPDRQFTFTLISNGCSNTLDARIARFSRKTFKLCWDAFATETEAEAFLVVDDDDE